MARPGPPQLARTPRGPVAEELADLVPRLYRLLRTALDEDPEVPSLEQLRVLQRVAEGLHHTSALAAARQMRMSAITSIVDALVQRGWVERAPDPVDRRRTSLELTVEGRRVLARGRRLTARRMGRVLVEYRGGTDRLAATVEELAEAIARFDDRSTARRAVG